MRPPIAVERTNTILYCDRWDATVAFYRDVLGLDVTYANDWFVEVRVAGTAHLSLARAERATIAAGNGVGITLSWRVADAAATHADLARRGIVATAPARRWDSTYVEMRDPEGTRIELWSPD